MIKKFLLFVALLSGLDANPLSAGQIFGSVQIYIESNGQLIVDGGVVTNADISMSSGGKITLKNGGTIVVQTGKDFNVPTNALLDMTNGKILRSNDF